MVLNSTHNTCTCRSTIALDPQSKLNYAQNIHKHYPSVGADPSATATMSPDACVPVIRVKLIHSLRLPPRKAEIVPVRIDGEAPAERETLLEPLPGDDSLRFASLLVKIDEHGFCCVMVMNSTGFTQKLQKGTVVGK